MFSLAMLFCVASCNDKSNKSGMIVLQDEDNEIDIVALQETMKITYDEAVYTPSSYNRYINALRQAQTFLDSNTKTNDKYQQVYFELNAAIEALNKKGDKIALREKIKEAEEYENNLINYYNASTTFFVSALKTARSYVDDNEATAEMINLVIKDLSDGIKRLRVRADKSELIELVTLASAIEKDKYIETDWKMFDLAFSKAMEITDKESATEEEINIAQKELFEVIGALTSKPNKTELQELYDKAIAIDETIYSKVTLNNLNQIKVMAWNALRNAKINQAEVDQVAAELNNAINELQYKVTKKYTVTCIATMISNNHVGDKWGYYTTINNYNFGKTYTFEEEPGTIIKAEATVYEDDKVPDYGSAFFDLVMSNGYTTSVYVTVIENRGVYAGKSAKWKMTYTVIQETNE